MNLNSKVGSSWFVLALVAAWAASVHSCPAQSATATIFGVQSGGVYNYTVTLNNTGSLALESFWYGWTQSGNNLPTNPSNAGNSLSWGNFLDGNSIEYVGSSLTPLNPNQSATFTFTSSDTPAQITAGVSGQSVAYVGGIDFSQNAPGDSTPVFAPVLIVPEPSTVCLFAIGSLGLLVASSRKLRP